MQKTGRVKVISVRPGGSPIYASTTAAAVAARGPVNTALFISTGLMLGSASEKCIYKKSHLMLTNITASDTEYFILSSAVWYVSCFLEQEHQYWWHSC
jgi:hypothetical protein